MASTQFSSTVTYVFPTENDVNGGSSGWGDTIQERTMAPLLAALGGLPARIINGFTLPSSGSASDRIVGASSLARIGAYLVGAGAAGYTISFPYSTNYVFLRLLRDGASKVTAAVIECCDSCAEAPPPDSILLGRVSTSAGNITGAIDGRPEARFCWGIVSSVGTTPFVYAGGSSDWYPSGNSGNGHTLAVNFEPNFFRPPALLYVGGFAWQDPSVSQLLIDDLAEGTPAPFVLFAM